MSHTCAVLAQCGDRCKDSRIHGYIPLFGYSKIHYENATRVPV